MLKAPLGINGLKNLMLVLSNQFVIELIILMSSGLEAAQLVSEYNILFIIST